MAAWQRAPRGFAPHHGRVSTPLADDEALPEALSGALARFDEHLAGERGRSAHTVRAYLSDVEGMLRYAAGRGATEVAAIRLLDLRGWLADQERRGLSRATLARRASSVRTFTEWAANRGLADGDAGARLASPKRGRRLPSVLTADQATQLLDLAETVADDPLGLRDAAMLEVLYASGIRVSELVGLDIDDVDEGRRTLRVIGKGDKERVVPIGAPALRAMGRWREHGRPSLVGSHPATHSSSAPEAIASIRARFARSSIDSSARCRAPPTSARTGCGTRRPRTCWRAGPTCARCRRSSATRAWPPRRSTRTSPSSACARRSSRRTRVPRA